MAAKQAASSTVTPVAQSTSTSTVRESTGRFDRIRIERVFAEVALPGYDLKKAMAKAQRRWAKPPPPTAAPAAANPVVFGAGSPDSQPSSSPPGQTAVDIHLDL